jgi:uncharacterized protein (DUF2336 family)
MADSKTTLIDDLDRITADMRISDRAAILRRVTDLFVMSSGRLSDEQMALFDDVMGRLLKEIDTSARITFSSALATASDAPPNVIRMLALDDAIDVAGPILTHSECLNDSTLVEGAKTKSQEHLLAISRRKTLPESVTDVLVEHGNQTVTMSVAENSGAAFSEDGYATLVQRSLNSAELAVRIWSRPEIPRQHLLKLFVSASAAVQCELTSKDPHKAAAILEAVAQASNQLQTLVREQSTDYVTAYGNVQSLYADGKLDEAQLAAFAHAGKFDETTIALSLICNLPIDLIERMSVEERSEQIIVIAKAIGLCWETVKAILLLQANAKNDRTFQSADAFEIFERLKADTAKKALHFYRLREQAKGRREVGPTAGTATGPQ